MDMVVTPLSSRKIIFSGADGTDLAAANSSRRLSVGFGVAFSGIERLFFSRNPNLRNKYQTLPRLSVIEAFAVQPGR